jgi:hypothetical protein
MALSIGLDVSFDNMKDWKGIGEKGGEVNRTKAYIRNYENSRRILNGRHSILQIKSDVVN